MGLAWFVTLSGAVAGDQVSSPAEPGYETGLTNLMQVVEELDEKSQQPIYLEKEETPVLTVAASRGGDGGPGTVCFSKGFVDLVNYMAHAKAVDEQKKGVLRGYVEHLAGRTSAVPVPPAFPSPEKAWTSDTINSQMGFFNQIGAGLIAVEMACVQLGYSRKYAGQLAVAGAMPASLSQSLSPADWRMAVLTGATNAVLKGYFTPGLAAFYQALDDMKTKPSWLHYFVPPGVKLSKMASDLGWLEDVLLDKGSSNLLKSRHRMH